MRQEIWYWTAGGVLNKKNWDLDKFMDISKASEKDCKMFMKLVALLTEGFPIRSVSSMNC